MTGADAQTGSGDLPRPEVRLVSGQLTDTELAAITVVLSTMSATSRLEAQERALAERFAGAGDGWMDPSRSMGGGHRMRTLASESAWLFSDR